MSLSTATLSIEVEFTRPVLGTAPLDQELYRKYILDKLEDNLEEGEELPKKRQEEEVETLPDPEEEIENNTTGFHRTDREEPFLYDYQFKGFLKEAAKMLRRADGLDTISDDIKAYRKKLNGLVFPKPEQLVLNLPEPIDICERPLRGQTARGERICLARSERAPVGTSFRVDIQLLDPDLEDWVRELLDYGQFQGIGQWRNSGRGRFTWREVNDDA